MTHEMERRGIWRDLSCLGQLTVPQPSSPLDAVIEKWRGKLAPLEDPLERRVDAGGPLYGRGLEEYARWLAWAARLVERASLILPIFGIRDVEAVQMCAGVSAEAAQLKNAPNWVLVRFKGRAFVGVELLDRQGENNGDEPELWRRATKQGVALWRVRLGEGGTLGWADLSRGLRSALPMLAMAQGLANASLAAHLAACIEQELLGLVPVREAQGHEALATAAYLEGALEWSGPGF